MSRPVRVRFAPSPTGFLHIGGLRTALYNFSFARRHGGKFILRIEDTDQQRLVPGSVESLLAALRWCGIENDEGPDVGGAFGPYVQSQRLPLYASAATRLLETGHAYRCFCSAERLDSLRKSQAKRGRTPLYDRVCARLPPGESASRAAAGEAHVVRLLVPPGHSVVDDAVRGVVSFSNADVDDQVLLKSDGWPTYHLANVVDDAAMGISHVIRGQEWLPSTPKHTLLYAALNLPPPTFAHLPILLNPDRSKLSKRSGDASVQDFKAGGYLPSALVQFVAGLGWTPPPEVHQDAVLDLPTLCSSFHLGGVHKGDAVVERAKLDSLNSEHIRRAMVAASGRGGGPTHHLAPLSLSDSPFLATVRGDVLPRVQASVEALLPGGGGGRATMTTDRLPVERLNAILLAQHERVRPLSDFVDLLLPFLLRGEEEWSAWMRRRGAVEAAGRIVAAHNKAAGGAKKDSGASAPVGPPESSAPAPEPTDGDVAGVVRPILRTVSAVVHAWDGESETAWGECGAGTVGEGEAAPLTAAKAAAKASGVSPGRLLLPLRFLLTGLDVGAGLGDTLRLLGRETCIQRLRWAVEHARAQLPPQ